MTPMKQLEQMLTRTLAISNNEDRQFAYRAVLTTVRNLLKDERKHIAAAYEAGYNEAKADHHFQQQEAQP